MTSVEKYTPDGILIMKEVALSLILRWTLPLSLSWLHPFYSPNRAPTLALALGAVTS